MLLIWGLLEILAMLTNRKRRAIHDFIAGTVVVKQISNVEFLVLRKILDINHLIYFRYNCPKLLPEERNLTFVKISRKEYMNSKLKKNSNCISIDKVTSQYDPITVP